MELKIFGLAIIMLLMLSNDDARNIEPQSLYIGRQIDGYVEPSGNSLYPNHHQLEYKDTYQSNIVIVVEEIYDLDIHEYEWFHTQDKYIQWQTVYQFICYAILTYYDGNVPCDYYVSIEEGGHNNHSESTMIFEVQAYSEKPLNICLDTYNYKIYVEEGIKIGMESWEKLERQFGQL